jgi:hypothetical protein
MKSAIRVGGIIGASLGLLGAFLYDLDIFAARIVIPIVTLVSGEPFGFVGSWRTISGICGERIELSTSGWFCEGVCAITEVADEGHCQEAYDNEKR